jgi:Domain of unknown function (DUF397)
MEMFPHAVRDESRPETEPVEPDVWRKSSHSPSGKGAACVEVPSAVLRRDDSVVVDRAGQEPFVLVRAPSGRPVLELLGGASEESGARWARGSRDEVADSGGIGAPRGRGDRVETGAEPVSSADLENVQGLAGFETGEASDEVIGSTDATEPAFGAVPAFSDSASRR